MASDIASGQPPFGLRILMWLSLLVGINAILGLILPHPLFLSKYAVPETSAQRAMSIAVGLLYMPLFWGIRRRSAVAWKFGWLVLFTSFTCFLVDVLESVAKQPGGRIGSAVGTIMTVGVASYWGVWWKRQRSYFTAISRPQSDAHQRHGDS
jgi:hypothetical protein